MPNLARRIATVLGEMNRVLTRCDRLPSRARVVIDALAYHVNKESWWTNVARDIRLKDGVKLRYRRNRGDWWSLREVWMYDCYRLPFALPAYDTLVDLGGNIGLTSVWLTKNYGFKKVIVVEPVPENARIAEANVRGNLAASSVEVISAAVGPADGTATFLLNSSSNQGRVSPGAGGEGERAVEVRVISMRTLLKQLSSAQEIDVLKLDIEGGEQALFEGDLDWLRSVRSIIAEFHPSLIDYPGLIRRIEQQGFVHLPAGSVFRDSMDGFVRADLHATSQRLFAT